MTPPPTEILIVVRRARWYVRLWRWVTMARRRGLLGSNDRPHHSFAQAMKDVPAFIPPNTIYTVDVSNYGLLEDRRDTNSRSG